MEASEGSNQNLDLKYLNFFSIIVVQFIGAMSGRSKANLYEVIMRAFQTVIKRSHEVFKNFLIKY